MKSIMTDFIGRPLSVGDNVVYSRLLGSKLHMVDTEVIGFTDTKVKILPLSCADEKRGYSLARPEKLVIYDAR